MMMAPLSGPGSGGSLSPETIERVQKALSHYIDAPATRDDALHSALHAMAREARANAMLPEQLLVVLKDIWFGLPTVRDARVPEDQVRLLQRVVTMCIKEYYAG